jgi:RsiW-degrading membrane proteinase PrsW (M82 family)
MTFLLLILLALVPATLLMYLVLYMDRNEREPLGLVLKTMMLGGLGFIPAVLVELALGWVPWPQGGDIPAALWDSFIKIAPIEELAKMAPVFLLAWGHPQFNEENDGIVYAGASALGFAAVENLFYVLSRGFAVGAARAVTSLPLHCFAGVVMGYYIGRAKFAPSGRNKLVFLGFLLAYLAHAVYDFLVLSKSLLALILLPMVAVLVIIGLKVLRKGRAMSLARGRPKAPGAEEASITEETSPTAATGAQEKPLSVPPVPKPASHVWKAALGRTLLGLSLLFWVLLTIGMVQQKDPMSIWKALAGGAIITFVPVLAGILLEISYQNGRRTAGRGAAIA